MFAISGWYPDPAGSPDLRYWDGAHWGASTVPAPRQAPPQQTAVALAPPPAPAYSEYVLPPYAREPYSTRLTPPITHRRSRGSKVITAVAVIIALGIGGGFVARAQDNTASKNAANNTTIQMPDAAAGLQKITGALADQLQALDAQKTGLQYVTHLTGGYQIPSGKPRAVVVIGKFAVPSRDFGTGIAAEERGAHNDETANGIPLTTFSKVDAGPLGGQMVCGTVQYPDLTGTECMFIDRATAGSITMLDVDGSDDHTLALQLRSAIETRT
ncbi:MAG TPA: DUF2510 domain-containing protein [Frankiaceae bacterium]|jgi:hypothetical protein|nr:DUF2510 domain-containing protein [Frankiaceae bacterium]